MKFTNLPEFVRQGQSLKAWQFLKQGCCAYPYCLWFSRISLELNPHLQSRVIFAQFESTSTSKLEIILKDSMVNSEIIFAIILDTISSGHFHQYNELVSHLTARSADVII